MPAEYLSMLIRLGQWQEAAEQAPARLRTAAQALSIARALHEQGQVVLALQVAEHGLTLPEGMAELTAWVSDLAAATNRPDLALSAALRVFECSSNLKWYLVIQRLAGVDWPEQQSRLLARIRQPAVYTRAGVVEILLHEQLWDEAITTVNEYTDYALLEQIVEAVIPHRPDWAIRTATRQAERIMDAAKSQSYDHAARWLKHAHDAYQAAGRQAEWSTYLAEIKAKHARKRSLMPLLSGL